MVCFSLPKQAFKKKKSDSPRVMLSQKAHLTRWPLMCWGLFYFLYVVRKKAVPGNLWKQANPHTSGKAIKRKPWEAVTLGATLPLPPYTSTAIRPCEHRLRTKPPQGICYWAQMHVTRHTCSLACGCPVPPWKASRHSKSKAALLPAGGDTETKRTGERRGACGKNGSQKP